MKQAFKLLSFLVLTVIASVSWSSALSLKDILATTPELRSDLPSPTTVTGVAVGERHWYHHEIVAYLDSLAAVSPRMVALGTHATSYGGRSLVSYAISSESNIAKLQAIKAARADIIDPTTTLEATAQPAVMHMMYSIHGNEPSGSNAAPMVAYYLNASLNPAIAAQLEDVVIIFNPMLNPDGLDRFAHWTNSHRGQVPSPDANDREHRETVPNGRTNYYGFDLNRDWLPHQHPESRGRLALFHAWKPNVQLDFHEQGSNSNFFFMPGKPERTNPLTPAINQALTAKIGEYHARAFDREGILYFSEEGYDDFFMGKGSTYPDLFGCVGILFEQPSSRGSRQDVISGRLTFPDTITNQFRASLSSLEATAELKDELLAYQQTFYQDNANQGASGYYLATANGDPTRLREFVRILEGHGIITEVLSQDTEVEGNTYRAGSTIAIPLDQSQSTYLKTLWNRQLEFEENIFYDVSTWTLPWAFNLQHTREPVQRVKTTAITQDFLTRSATLAASNIGYLIDWRDSASPTLLYGLLEARANVRVAQRPFTASVIDQGRVDFGYGSLLVTPQLNDTIPAQALTLMQTAAANGLPVYPVASSHTPQGIDLGSRDFHVLQMPKVLIATGAGTSAYDVGEIWHLLDRRVQMPLTMVDTHQLSRIDLAGYTHVILTNPLRQSPDQLVDNLRRFVLDGGVLWAQGAATIEWLSDKDLTAVHWRATEASSANKEAAAAIAQEDTEAFEALLPERRPYADARDEAAFKLVRGVILEGKVDITHPVGYGYTEEMLPMFRRSANFMARSENAYSTPIVYGEAPLLSGYMSAENQALAGSSASLIVDAQGDGAVVLALDAVTFRAFWWGTQKLLINTLFFGSLLEEPR
ncbi:MAG: M14 family zinc carboxypeptidase [Luminiphilus sp.]|nr:M14 family zinc carboxypeptidase [Luminiphilus sp.]